jgi:ammonia channel protein AmtB
MSAEQGPSAGEYIGHHLTHLQNKHMGGIVDFSGCGAVHMVGGFSGIVGAYMVGPRIGRYNSDGTVNAKSTAPH